MSSFQTGLEGALEKVAAGLAKSIVGQATKQLRNTAAASKGLPKGTSPIKAPGPGAPKAPSLTPNPAEQSLINSARKMDPVAKRKHLAKELGLHETPQEAATAYRARDAKRVQTQAAADAKYLEKTRRESEGPPKARKGMGRLGKGLLLGGGLAAAGTGYAIHKEHQRDQQHRGLAYAPMSGTIGTSGLY